MIMALVILLIVIAVAGIIGGVSMLFSGCLFSSIMGYNAITGGFEILVKIVPALLSALNE